jgi:hypothetical protein
MGKYRNTVSPQPLVHCAGELLCHMYKTIEGHGPWSIFCEIIKMNVLMDALLLPHVKNV